MSKKKKFSIILGIGLSLLLVSFIWIKTTNYPVYSQPLGVSVTDKYDSINEIEDASSVIVDAAVEKSESFVFNDVPFTISTLTVNKVYKGEIKKGDSINLLETGGVIDNVEYTIEEDKVLKKKEKAILYLTKYEGPILEDIDKYVVSGLYQGKFKFKDDKSITPSEHNYGELLNVQLVEDLELKEKNN